MNESIVRTHVQSIYEYMRFLANGLHDEDAIRLYDFVAEEAEKAAEQIRIRLAAAQNSPGGQGR